MFLRQSTTSQEIILGPFLDDTDGKTAETGLTIANTDIKLWKSGGTTESDKNSGGATHIAGGRYYAVLDDTDTNTVGMLEVAVSVSGALPVRRQFYILEEAVYDQLFAGSAAGYQVPIWSSSSATVNLSGTTIKTATDVETDTQDIQSRIPAALVDGRMVSVAQVVSDKTGYKLASDGLALVTSWTVDITGSLSGSVGSISGVTFPSNFAALGINASGHISRVVLVDTTTTNTDMRGTDGAALATNWTATRAGYLDGVLIAANYNQRTVTVTGSNHVAADIHELQPAVIDNTHFAAGAIDANAIATDAIDADALAASANTEIANAVAATQALSRLDSMIESDGAGQFRFDTIAVSLASQGGGGGAVNISVEDQSITVC